MIAGVQPRIGRRRLGLLLGLLPVRSWARELPGRTQPAILTVSGRIRRRNEGDRAVFDRPMLHALGSASITTQTPWYDAPVRFDGVPLASVMEAVGAEGTTVTAIALNDYSTDIPMPDLTRFDVLLATHRNGVPMPANDRGPLFIVYPYDANPVLRSPLYYGRSAWSVSQLIVR